MRFNNFLFFFLIFLSTHIAIGQNKTVLYGSVVDGGGLPVKMYDLSLWVDSAIVSGKTCDSCKFFIIVNKNTKYDLRVSNVMFQPQTISLETDGNDSINVGNIVLLPLEIDGVVVTSKKPLYKREFNKVTVSVEDSYLQNLGKSVNVIKLLPGIIVKGNDISFIEGGTPTILINNKQVRNYSELSALQSSDIKSIIVDTDPNVKYSASNVGVIKIITKRKLSDYFSVDISDRFTIARKYGNFSNIAISNKISNVSNYLSLGYDFMKIVQYDNTSETVYSATDTLYSKKVRDIRATAKDCDIFYSFNWDVNDKNTLGLQYSGNISAMPNVEPTSQSINNTVKNYMQHKYPKFYMHNISFNYSLQIDSAKNLSIVGDYASVLDKSREYVNTKNVVNTNTRNSYNVFGTQVDFTLASSIVNISAGTSLSIIDDNGRYAYNTLHNTDDVDENTYAAYVSGNKTISGYYVKIGMRGEFIQRKLKENHVNIIDTSYFRLFPSLLVRKKLSDNFGISMSVAQRIRRPSYSELSPSLTYYDEISYSVGNPGLKPTITTDFRLSANIHDFTVSAKYTMNKDYILDVAVWEEDPSIGKNIKWTSVNFDNAKYFTGSVTYDYKFGPVHGWIGAYFRKPFINVVYLGNKRSIREPQCTLKTDAEMNLAGSTNLSASFYYQTSGEYGLGKHKKTYGLDLGVSHEILNGSLVLYLGVNDIFHNNKSNAWTMRYENIKATMDSDEDSRQLIFSIRYKFGKVKGNYEKKSANEDSLDRIH